MLIRDIFIMNQLLLFAQTANDMADDGTAGSPVVVRKEV